MQWVWTHSLLHLRPTTHTFNCLLPYYQSTFACFCFTCVDQQQARPVNNSRQRNHHAGRRAVACQRRPAGAVQLVHTCRHRLADKGSATVPAAQLLAGSHLPADLTTAFAHSLANSLSCPLITVAVAITSFLTLTFTFAGYIPIPIPIPQTSGCSATTSGPAATRAWHAAPALLSLMVLPTASSNQPHSPMVNHPTRWASALVLRA